MIRHEEKGIVWYESELINAHGVRHGFFGRSGGVSKPPFDSLNVKLQIGEKPENVIENRRRAMAALGLVSANLHFADLCHGTTIQTVNDSQGSLSHPDTDALATAVNRQALMLSVADCAPIILAGAGKFTALIHAGWRGLDAGIIGETVSQCAKAFKIPASEMVAAIGPAVAGIHYEVGREVAAKFVSYKGAVTEQAGIYHLDIVKVARQQLQRQGIKSIDESGVDVFDSQEFFSYRREQPTGRNAVVAALVA